MSIIRLQPPGHKPRTFSFCKGCRSKIMWVVTATGKNMAIEFDPKIEYLFDGIVKPYFDPKTMVSHFAKCPRAEFFRKG